MNNDWKREAEIRKQKSQLLVDHMRNAIEIGRLQKQLAKLQTAQMELSGNLNEQVSGWRLSPAELDIEPKLAKRLEKLGFTYAAQLTIYQHTKPRGVSTKSWSQVIDALNRHGIPHGLTTYTPYVTP